MTLQISADGLNSENLSDMVRTLTHDGVVCFPTDTVYGLAVNPSSSEAVERLFTLKGRDASKPILLLVDSIEMARTLSVPNLLFEEVARAFWPGPLTLVTGAREHLLTRLTAGTGTIGLRYPDARVSCQLIEAFGCPVTGTSANRSGLPVAGSPDDVIQQFGNEVDIVIDGGSLKDSSGSTVLDVSSEAPVLLREGPVTYETLIRFFDGRLRRLSA